MTFQQTNESFIKNILLKVWFQDDWAMPSLIKQTLGVFDEWIQSETLLALSDDQMESFDSLISNDPSDEEIYNFFVSNIKDFDNFMDGLYDKFENMYISEYKKSLKK